MPKEKQIRLDDEGQSIQISKMAGRPEAQATVYIHGKPWGSFSLLHRRFERPLLFLAGPHGNQVICVYDFDVGLRLLVFDTSALARSAPIDRELRHIVRYSEFQVRNGTRAELEFIRTAIEHAKPVQIREWSIPTSWSAWLTTYPNKQAILRRLHELQESQRGDGSNVIDG